MCNNIEVHFHTVKKHIANTKTSKNTGHRYTRSDTHGIGDALGQAYRAVEGDIAGVTASLGIAFNSTFIALVISIALMFFMHQLQLIQERLVLDTHAYCDQRLLRHMQVR